MSNCKCLSAVAICGIVCKNTKRSYIPGAGFFHPSFWNKANIFFNVRLFYKQSFTWNSNLPYRCDLQTNQQTLTDWIKAAFQCKPSLQQLITVLQRYYFVLVYFSLHIRSKCLRMTKTLIIWILIDTLSKRSQNFRECHTGLWRHMFYLVLMQWS